MSGMQLREYQTRALDRLRAEYSKGHRRVCLVLPTGAGKTHTAASACVSAVAKGRRVLWLAHRSELVDQAIDAFAAQGITAGAIAAGSARREVREASVYCASVQTLIARNIRPEADLVVLDECHHFVADEFRGIPDAYPKAHIVGLTATPERGDGRGLGEMFDSVAVGVTCRELVQLGHLVHAEILAPSERLKANQIAQTPAQAYAKYAKGRPTVVFCRTVAEAVNHTAEFERDGVRAGYVTGAMANDVRRNVLARFKAGELDALCNVMVLTEGWDSPATSCAIIARSVGTTGLWLQMVGRVLRLSPGKSDALIIDLQGNSIEHGHPEDDYTFSLDGKGCRKGGADFPACPVCSAPMAGPACEECGFVREAWTDKPGSEVTGDELVKYARKLAEGADKRLETLKRWCQYAAARDYLPGWVYHKYKTVYKSEPSRIDVARFMAQWRAA